MILLLLKDLLFSPRALAHGGSIRTRAYIILIKVIENIFSGGIVLVAQLFVLIAKNAGVKKLIVLLVETTFDEPDASRLAGWGLRWCWGWGLNIKCAAVSVTIGMADGTTGATK